MPQSKTQIQRFLGGFLLACLAGIFLVGCQPKSASPSQTATAVENSTALPSVPTPISAPAPTSTATQTPLKMTAVSQNEKHLIVVSMADGYYSHLFIYNPDSLPFTRLTGGNADDEDPAVSPDGTKVAFSSNRGGSWDIYILDLQTAEIRRFTQTQAYDGAPAWSPDGQYLIYQTLNGNNLDLLIQSVNDSSAAPIQLTSKSGDNFEPSWSADGRTIAFISNRNGQNEVWLADLQSVDNRFKLLVSSNQVQYSFPRWSPDGTSLAWCRQDAQTTIETISLTQANAQPLQVGSGCHPAWTDDGQSIIAVLDQPNAHYLVGYNVADRTLLFPPMKTDAALNGLDWVSSAKSLYLANYASLENIPAPAALFTPKLTLPTSSNGRSGVVPLKEVDAPNAYLADSANEAFDALRDGIGRKSGWDFLAILENAYLPLTTTSSPGIPQNWLYTGRAIEVNTVPIDAGWMAVTREDFDGQTYWRVWVKCLDQKGNCGKPMTTPAWDFSARFDSDPAAYENGGKAVSIPEGYWIDFTEFASRYGWQRVPSRADWRYYYPGILFNQFVYSEGLTWENAMLQLFPADALSTAGSGN